MHPIQSEMESQIYLALTPTNQRGAYKKPCQSSYPIRDWLTKTCHSSHPIRDGLSRSQFLSYTSFDIQGFIYLSSNLQYSNTVQQNEQVNFLSSMAIL